MSRSLLVWLLLAAGAPAHAEEFHSVYSVSVMGLSVAQSEFTTTVGPDSFTIEGRLASSGLARLFDETKGKVRVTGRMSSDGLAAESYRIDYTNGEKNKRTAIRFSGGEVTETVNEPPLKKRGDDWVRLEAEHLKGVADPISATLVRAKSLREVCRRTIRVFDGQMRADLKLSPAGEGEWNGTPTASCQVRFVPVAGYRKNKRSIDYLARKSRIRIDFAALGKTGLYAPVSASVGTRLGTVTIEAEELQAASN